MNKEFFMTLAAVCLVAGLSANQAAAPAAAVAPAAQEKSVAANLSADELAFAAKLSDQNRKAFTQLSAEQRKAAMVSACATGSCATGQKAAMSPNDAVQKVVKEGSVVAEKREAAPAAQVK